MDARDCESVTIAYGASDLQETAPSRRFALRDSIARIRFSERS